MIDIPEVGVRPCLLPQSWDEVVMLGIGVAFTLINLLIHLHGNYLKSDWRRRRANKRDKVRVKPDGTN